MFLFWILSDSGLTEILSCVFHQVSNHENGAFLQGVGRAFLRCWTV